MHSLPVLTSKLSLLLALAAGAITVFAFAPFGFWPLQITTLATVYWLVLREERVKHSALLGWMYGTGCAIATTHWLYISMHQYGGLPAGMAAVAVVLFGGVLGAFSALAMGITTWLRQRWHASDNTALLLILPSTWTLGEWLRGWVLTGFPWSSSGYAHSTGPLAGFAPVVGVYGVTLLSAWIAGAVVLASSKKTAAALALIPLAAGWGLKNVAWTEINGAPISVRLLQGNVPQDLKFDPEQIASALQLYHDMIREAPADLIATPETAVPLLSHQLPPDYLARLSHFSQQSNSHLLLGLPISDGPSQYANSVIGFSPFMESKPYRYDKHHLVPFGEFIPLGAHWFVNMMQIPLGDFTRGKLLQAPFQVKDQWVLPNICYEDLFGEEIAARLADGYFSNKPQATILLNVSNIAWFGNSIALPQHLQISQMRALESGRPMLRATNTGTTAIINPQGKIVAQLPALQRDILTVSVQGHKGMTPYLFYGNKLVLTLALLMLGAAWSMCWNNRGKSHNPCKTR